ncbi:hypothetical protein L8106_15290 [Lyngbya sp. PCC 8106]|nr:hypothetical protein L8106_15290 [Lyngbya sp. PCC 8106]
MKKSLKFSSESSQVQGLFISENSLNSITSLANSNQESLNQQL